VKRFKDFIKGDDNPEFKYNPETMGNPALIKQGKHSVSKKFSYNPQTMGNPVLIKQGKHSVTKKPIKEGWGQAMVPKHTDAWSDHEPQYRGTYSDPDDHWSRTINPTKHPAQIGMDRFKKEYHQTLHSMDDLVKEKFHNSHERVNTNHGNDINEVHRSLSEHYNNDDHPNFHPIHRYSSGSGELNARLFNSHMAGHEPGNLIDGHNVEKLDEALGHFQLHKPLTVFSGLHFNPKIQASGNGRLFLPAYTSTSIAAHTASGFGAFHNRDTGEQEYNEHKPMARHLLKIDLKEGQKGNYLGHHSNYPDEREFLLPRRSVIQLHNTAPELHDAKNGYGAFKHPVRLHIWHGTVLHPHEYS
jgi:hypothetical protein